MNNGIIFYIIILDGQQLLEFPVHPGTDCCKAGAKSYMFNIDNETILFKFLDKEGM